MAAAAAAAGRGGRIGSGCVTSMGRPRKTRRMVCVFLSELLNHPYPTHEATRVGSAEKIDVVVVVLFVVIDVAAHAVIVVVAVVVVGLIAVVVGVVLALHVEMSLVWWRDRYRVRRLSELCVVFNHYRQVSDARRRTTPATTL